MLNINSISFDLTDCSLHHSDDKNERGWTNEYGVAHLLRFHQTPPQWPFDLSNPDGARKFYSEQCASNGGVMLTMDIQTIDNIEVLRGIFKYRAPMPTSLAMYFVGILWIPFSNYNYQLNIEAMEQGTTGMREAVVYAMNPDRYADLMSAATEEPEPVQVSSAEEMYAHMRSKSLRSLPSDEEQYDSLFPDHPLSLVRGRLAKVCDTLKMDKMWWQELKPFRIS